MFPTSLKKRYDDLTRDLKKFGNTRCKYHTSQKYPKRKSKWTGCHHPAMGYGGISRNTDCKLDNCPRL